MNTVAHEIARESLVLLENRDGLLPFAPGASIAVFGRAQCGTYYSGNGSGAAHGAETESALAALKEAAPALAVCPELAAFYETEYAKEVAAKPPFDFGKLKNMVNSGLMYEFFGKYTPPDTEYAVPANLLATATRFTDTALLIVGRNSGGEECDRHLKDDYYLTPDELALVDAVCGAFKNVVVVLNVNGTVDLAWTEQYPNVKSIVFMGLPGEAGGIALAEVLSGKVNPSGKLSFTIAKSYDDYPSAKYFSFEKEEDDIRTYADYGLDAAANGSTGFAKSPVTLYREDVFNGYRYFDTFGVAPRYSFGHGLSYTTFALAAGNATTSGTGADSVLTVPVTVTNTGAVPGKETVEVYVCAETPDFQNRPRRTLVGFEKTALLAPGESQTVTVTVRARDFAAYHEESSAWVIDAGTYRIQAGSSLAGAQTVCAVVYDAPLVVEQCAPACGIKPCNAGKIDFLTAPAEDSAKEAVGSTNAGAPAMTPNAAPAPVASADTVPNDVPVFALAVPSLDGIAATVAGLSDQELAALCVGWGPGIPFAFLSETEYPDTINGPDGKPLTVSTHPVGNKGYVSPAIPDKGVTQSVFYKDGPAGVGMTVWPTETIAACSFNKELLHKMRESVAAECVESQVEVWLAPAVNLHRNPLCGRNFEYYSEDPYLAGTLAVALAQGVQKGGRVIVCPKHFAANEQETYRRGSTKKNYDAVDSIVSERALRELYLRPFEKLVREAGVLCIMSSFNKINGTFAGENAGMLRQILRNEWGFKGVVVTDWGDMDIVLDGANGVAAGNDVIMPGGVPVIEQILKGFDEGRVTRAQLEEAVRHLLYMVRSVRG